MHTALRPTTFPNASVVMDIVIHILTKDVYQVCVDIFVVNIRLLCPCPHLKRCCKWLSSLFPCFYLKRGLLFHRQTLECKPSTCHFLGPFFPWLFLLLFAFFHLSSFYICSYFSYFCHLLIHRLQLCCSSLSLFLFVFQECKQKLNREQLKSYSCHRQLFSFWDVLA